ncbi:MAG: phosphoglycerate kinase [Acidimicrobiales bacterium]|nr:MAG: phosphoglycerate kinase [Acidimicrobiales bacterium]
MDFRRLEDALVEGKRVLVRVDFNVPCDNAGNITDDTRIRTALPTIKYLQKKGAKVILISHYGRPGGKHQAEASLLKIVSPLSDLLDTPIAFAPDCVGEDASQAVNDLEPGNVLLLENTRFHVGEQKNPNGLKGYDPEFAKKLASFGEIFVHDAFSVSHRSQASTTGIAETLTAYAGMAMERELDHISQALNNPKRPVMALVGGAKVSTKIDLLKNLVTKLDTLAIGGGMANTFLAAQGFDVGGSLCEHDLKDTALAILRAAKDADCEVLLPVDVVAAENFAAHAPHRVCNLDDVAENEMILDAGPQTVSKLLDAIDQSRTLIWNGPLGAFELAPFDTSTVEAAKYTARRVQEHGLIAVAGGGDTVAALKHAGAAEGFTFISTAGGAFLEWMEGKPLPGVEILKK